MTDWSKYAPAPTPYDPANDDAEFERGIGNLPSPQPQPGPQLSDDEEFRRAMGQSATSAKQGTTDWSKIGTDAPAGSGVGWSKYPDAPADTPPNYSAMPWSQVVEKGVNNLLPSAWNSVKSVPQAIYNYQDTGRAIGQIASGAASKAEGLFSQQDPAQKAQNEAALEHAHCPLHFGCRLQEGSRGGSVQRSDDGCNSALWRRCGCRSSRRDARGGQPGG